ncbi:MAG: hypothetical protein RLZZ156_164 [Deinococcota bacterium]
MNRFYKFGGLAILALMACAPIGTTATTGGTAGVLCDYTQSVFNNSASVNATSTVKWSCTTTSRVLSGNGIPDHVVGAFPNANNPNKISAQNVAVTFSLAPEKTTTSTTLGGPRGAVGYMLNSVKLDPDTGGSCNDSGSNCTMNGNVGQWRMEALGGTSFNFGVDSNTAHVQPTGEYHYHGMPEGYLSKLNKGQAMTLVGWAADGFPIYARYGYTTATDATSAIKVMTGSYRTKLTPDANRPATNLYAMGTFKNDWEYVAGLSELDECNGRTGVTPEFPNGTYHYYATDTYPFLQRCVKGKVAVSSTQMPPPPSR